LGETKRRESVVLDSGDNESYWSMKEATYRRRNEALRGTNAFDSSRLAPPFLHKIWSLRRCSLNPRPFFRMIGRKTEIDVVTVMIRLCKRSSAGNLIFAHCYNAEARVEDLTMK